MVDGPCQERSSASRLSAIQLPPALTRIQRGEGSTRKGGTSISNLGGRPRPKPPKLWGYLPALRCQRVALSIFLCFFLRMRLRRFLMREPMAADRVAKSGRPPPLGSVALVHRGSSNGKTAHFGCANGGSIPPPRASSHRGVN